MTTIDKPGPPVAQQADGADKPAVPGTDGLDLLPYAQALADIVETCDTPLTVGIQGELGIGKTTLMNLLRGDEVGEGGLLDSSLCKVVSLETWPYAQFGDGNELVIDTLRALVRKTSGALQQAGLSESEFEHGVEHALGHLEIIRQRIAPTANASPQPAHESPSDEKFDDDICALLAGFRQTFTTLAGAWTFGKQGRRLVVFIDDLDRIQPREAVMLLESIRQFTNVRGCVFVVSIDYDVVQQGMNERFGPETQRTGGKAFYDRYIQLPFNMPAMTYPIGPFVTGLLQRAGYPYADELPEDESGQAFYHDVTLCTVGRNPRNIKRVMNTTKLLERIRYRQVGELLSRRDAKVLYALTCMQIAWPELFAHFVADPTVDTVTSLQNWNYLSRLSSARRLFEHQPDPERVHVSVATFFDNLFALLDENDDGQIDTRELGPVLDLMNMAHPAIETVRERPRDWFVRRVRENNHDQDPLVTSFLESVFLKSVWYLGSECRYHRSGSRFVTLTFEGRQIACLVTLRTRPFVFRLALPPEQVKAGLKAYWNSKQSVDEDAITLTRAAFGKEASMTGFGDTFVDFSRMTRMRSKEAIRLLNALFRIATGDPLSAWERESGSKK